MISIRSLRPITAMLKHFLLTSGMRRTGLLADSLQINSLRNTDTDTAEPLQALRTT